MVVYNAIPHASRGFSPHYLIFGREPFLCIYLILAFNVANDEFNNYVDACNVNIDSVNVDEWFQSHLTRLREAHVRVDDQRKKQADTRKESAIIAIHTASSGQGGGKKRVHHVGRSKTADVWDEDLFIVVRAPTMTVGGQCNLEVKALKNLIQSDWP